VDEHKLIVWRADIETQEPFRGVIGRIVYADEDRGWLVQAGNGLLWLTEVEFAAESTQGMASKMRIGIKLGDTVPDEIHSMQQRISELEGQVVRLEHMSNKTV
jgi:hypothetical protein